jgi:hypothetical protein
MKMYEFLALPNFYASIHEKKMPVKTAYKLSKLAKRAEEETQFYQSQFQKIIDEYALREDGQLVYSEDMSSIKIIPGKEDECAQKIVELRELEVDIKDLTFSIDEFENLELTVAEMSALFPLIAD